MIYVEQGHHEGDTRSLERDRVGIGRYSLGNESVPVLAEVGDLLSLFISRSVT